MFDKVIAIGGGKPIGEPMLLENFKRTAGIGMNHTPTAEQLSQLNAAYVSSDQIPKETSRTDVRQTGWKLGEDGYVTMGFEQFDKSPEELDLAQIAMEERSARDEILKQYDWYAVRAQMGGDPVPADVATYCQALRDLPSQAGWPLNIDWPVAPGAEATSTEEPA